MSEKVVIPFVSRKWSIKRTVLPFISKTGSKLAYFSYFSRRKSGYCGFGVGLGEVAKWSQKTSYKVSLNALIWDLWVIFEHFLTLKCSFLS